MREEKQLSNTYPFYSRGGRKKLHKPQETSRGKPAGKALSTEESRPSLGPAEERGTRRGDGCLYTSLGGPIEERLTGQRGWMSLDKSGRASRGETDRTRGTDVFRQVWAGTSTKQAGSEAGRMSRAGQKFTHHGKTRTNLLAHPIRGLLILGKRTFCMKAIPSATWLSCNQTPGPNP